MQVLGKTKTLETFSFFGQLRSWTEREREREKKKRNEKAGKLNAHFNCLVIL